MPDPMFDDVLAERVAVDGAQVLDDVYEFLGRYVNYPSEAAHVAHTLWIGHTWFMGWWESTPRIAFLSAESGSGKSRALEVTEPLVPNPVHAMNITPAYLIRKIADPESQPTVLYDEIDTVFGAKTKDQNEEIRGLINAGHRRGAVAGRCVVRGTTVLTEELPAYAPMALAGLKDLPDTIRNRSVIVRMRRRAKGETVEPWRQRIGKQQAIPVREGLERWAAQDHKWMWPEMPDGIADRDADVWEALLVVADVAGGDWPERARDAAVKLVVGAKDTTQSLGIQLLGDLRAVFGDRDKLPTKEIVRGLIRIEDSPWSTWPYRDFSGADLARLIGDYQTAAGERIKSKIIRYGGGDPCRGYKRDDFCDAWERYLPADEADPDGAGALTEGESDGYGF